jgi:hypothetical protein
MGYAALFPYYRQQQPFSGSLSNNVKYGANWLC